MERIGSENVWEGKVGSVRIDEFRHPDGSTQQIDISEQNYRDLKLAGVGKTLKKRGRKPGSTTADSTPRKRRRRQTSEPPVTA